MRPEEMDIIDRQIAITTNLMVRVSALEKSLLSSGVIDQKKHQEVIAEMQDGLRETVKAVVDDFREKLNNPEQLSLFDEKDESSG